MKRFREFFVAAFFLPAMFISSVSACPLCRAQVESEIFDRNFFGNLFMLLSPLIIITAIGFGLYQADKVSDRLRGIK
jgi:hypothetical protein